eukprot:CCRYP_012420-RA/>CCRYP_012420-RA protein AED:0.06 eAED:0.10 QI:4762/0.8/0.66/1/0.6/0.33/6/1549/641
MSLYTYNCNGSPETESKGSRFGEKVELENEWRTKTYFPALPGFQPSTSRPPSAKYQSLSFVNGYMMVRSPPSHHNISRSISSPNRPMTAPIGVAKEISEPLDVSARYSFYRKKVDRQEGKIPLPFCPSSSLPPFLQHDRRVLLFNAYYEESVLQSATEDRRILVCEIYFYVEDGTIEIIRTKQENSGIPQGVFLRRSKVEKPGSSRFYEINDLKIGNEIMIYGRKFHIANCNGSTKEYVIDNHDWNMHEVEPRPLPSDRFAESIKDKMMRESGLPGVDRKRKMNDLKQVMESMLGKETSFTDRGMFLACGTDALCFHVVWDDRERLYGDIQYFRLFYYLADDTIEIMRAQAKSNDGRDPFPKLLKRSKLPKSGRPSEGCDYYTWKDLAIGQALNVFGRVMLIGRCDAFTRQYYASKGICNGFGTEEDSLRSCTGGLNPPPPKKDQKQRDKSGVILRFNAQLVSDKSDDTSRRFVIQFFMEDDTISIREPPVRNSGVMGGNFLRRHTIKRSNGECYSAKDMYVGNTVDIVGHRFLLLNADEYSYKLMECDDRTFPYSSLPRLQEILYTKQDQIRAYFVTHYDGNGLLDIERLTDCCNDVGLKLNKQEIITIWRKMDKKGKGEVAFKKLLALASEEAFCSARA